MWLRSSQKAGAAKQPGILSEALCNFFRRLWHMRTFKGGIHPYEGKELTEDIPIKHFVPEGEIVIPIAQHIGAPAIPVVEKGDRVLEGQLIAQAAGPVSANIHASVSGTVKAIEPRRVTNGAMVTSIVIENDGEYEKFEDAEYDELLSNLTMENIRQIIRKSGIVGMGGAGFPTDVKLTPPKGSEIDHVIVNGSECEPYLTSDYRRMLEEPEAIVNGLKTMLLLFPNAKGVIAIEDNKPQAIKIMREAVKDDPDISVCVLKTKYPQGGERQLIYAVTGRKINSKMLPANAGCIVDNIDTVHAIYRAVKYGEPLTSRIVTVTGDGVKEPKNYEVRIGTSHAELLRDAGCDIDECEKIISGGPMMGTALFNLDVPIIKTSSAILCLKKDPVTHKKQTNCINCGRCMEACPENLMCTRLVKFSNRRDSESFEKFNGLECIECGCCSYACPAKRDLAQAIKTMKKRVLAEKRSGGRK